jgi:aminoglycoside phosphotransferase family enzyme/predicted kinase
MGHRLTTQPPDPSTAGEVSDVLAPGSLDGACFVDTHLSLLVFVGDRVYKLRKAVRFDFVDFTSREAREADCHREVELNRRLAPDVYLGVIDILSDGRPIDHMVVMRRLPEECRLASMVRSGTALDEHVRAIGHLLASFHAVASRSPRIDRSGTPERLFRSWESHYSETDRFRGSLLDPDVDDEIRQLVGRYLLGRDDLLFRRIELGAICDGHGDLQAEDVFCLEDGPRILDCLEFDDELRYGDVLADLAFLVMDLERLGATELADRLVVLYREFTGCEMPLSLLHFYCASRAYVRTKVSCLRHEQEPAVGTDEIRRLHALCRSFLERARVRLVLVGGLPGSGKSTLAGRLALDAGAVVLNSDEIRKELAGLPVNVPAPASFREGLYTEESTLDTYRTMLSRAEVLLRNGESVILDASWADAELRGVAGVVAERTATDLTEVRCSAPPALMVERVESRRLGEPGPSDATVEILKAMAAHFDPWPDASVIDTRQSLQDSSLQALALLREESRGSDHAAEGPDGEGATRGDPAGNARRQGSGSE